MHYERAVEEKLFGAFVLGLLTSSLAIPAYILVCTFYVQAAR